MNITKAQLVCIKVLVKKLAVAGDAMALGYSGGRTKHISELTSDEARMMIKELKKMDPDEVAAEKMRKKIIGMAYTRAGLPRSASKAQKQGVVDWLNGWCKQYGFKHKPLNSYTNNELPKLVSQFEAVLNNLIISI